MAKKNRHKITNDKEIEYKLLPDSPIPADKEQDIKFGHPQIARVITDLVKNAEPPFTIGLFGKWGVGKTTILNLVQKYAEQENIKSVIFDVWKYEEDSLRRQFLITLDEKLSLGLNYGKTLNQSLSQPIALSFSQIIKISSRNFLARAGVLIFLAVLLIIAGALAWFGTDIDIFKFITSVGILAIVLDFLLGSIVTLSATREEARTDSAEGFEDRFYNEILPKVKSKKLLITIDNLDRTTHDKATDLLSDIKTFLGKDRDDNKVIFLIACDDRAIKKHLIKSNLDDPDEFLRKFFNAGVRIPRFLNVELDEYTRSLIEETGIKEFRKSSQLEWLITYAFRDNPREIKQFLNTLIGHFLLARRMEGLGQIEEPAAVTGNVEFLAKLLIIRQKFSDEYTDIEERALRKALTWEEIESNPSIIAGKGKKKGDKFEKFIRDTDHIRDGELSLFIRVRQSEQERSLPGWDHYRVAAEDKDIDTATKLIRQFISKDLLDEFDLLLRDYVRQIKGSDKQDKLLAFGSTSIVAIRDAEQPMNMFLNEFTRDFPQRDTLLKTVEDLPAKLIFETVFPQVGNKNRIKIIDGYLSLFEMNRGQNKSVLSDESALEILEIIANHPEYFEGKEKTIQSGIENYFFTEKFLKLFIKPELQQKFVTEKAKENFINSVSTNVLSELQVLKEKLKLLERLDVKKQLDKVLSKIQDLMAFETQQGLRQEQRLFLTNWLVRFTEKHKEAINQLKDKTHIEAISNNLINSWYPQDSNWPNRINYFELANGLKNIEGNPLSDQLEVSILRDFVSNAPYEDCIEILDGKRVEKLAKRFPEGFQAASLRDLRIFMKGYRALSAEQNQKVVIHLIDSKPDEALQVLDIPKARNNIANPSELVSKILNKAPEVSLPPKEGYYDNAAKLITKNRAKIESGLISTFHQQLLTLKSAGDEGIRIAQKFSKRRFFNSAQRQELRLKGGE